MEKYDVAVIGGGPGGYSSAIRLGELGKKVVLFEKNRLGGECLNYGCIPTKTYINIVKIADRAEKFHERGIVGSVQVELKALKRWKDTVVAQLSKGVESLCRSNGVQVVKAEAKLIEPNTVEYSLGSQKERVYAENVVLATGSKPMEIPGFAFDGETILHNWHMLELESVPEKLAIVGGGVLGMEFAFMFSKMGSEVSVIEMMPQILPGTDSEVAAAIYDSAVKAGIKLYLGAKVGSWSKVDGKAEIRFQDKAGEHKLQCDKILLSVGRKPASAEGCAGSVGVATDSKGFVKVDASMRTSVKGVYAIGDLVAGPMLAHKAYRQGVVAAEAIAGLPSEFDSVVPDAIFTDPEAASVGLDLVKAGEAGYNAMSAKFPLMALGRAVSVDE
ncbi:MAG: dihydrolipoyl dehydrogenase, partial [Thermoprotei archaeon]